MANTPWGSIIETAGGAVGGGVSNYFAQGDKRKALNSQIKGSKALQKDVRNLEARRTGEVNQAYAPQLEGFDDFTQQYFANLSDADLEQYALENPDEFQFDMEQATQAEMNPNLQAVIDRELGNVKSNAVASGSLFSGATGKDIARSTADIQAKEWDSARQRAGQQQGQKYQQFTDRWAMNKDVVNQNRQNKLDELGLQGQRYGLQSNAFGNARGEITGTQQMADEAWLGSQADIKSAQAEKAGTSRGWRSVVQGAGSGLAGGR